MSKSKIVNIQKIKDESQNHINGTIQSITIGNTANELSFKIKYKNREELEDDLLLIFDIRERYLVSFIEDNIVYKEEDDDNDDDTIVIDISDNAALYFIEQYFNVQTSYYFKLDNSKENIIFQ